MKKLSFIFLLSIGYMALFAQQEPQFTQYMFNKVSINPASAGVSGAVCLTGFGRNQWIGFKDSTEGNAVYPRTYGLSFDMPLYAIKSGVGLTFQYGTLGAEKNIDVKLHYAYHHVFKKKHMLSFGLSFGLLHKSIDYSKLRPAEFDPLLGNDVEKGTITDIDLGIHYQLFKKFYAGVSVTNLLGSSAEIGAPEFTLTRHYYVFSGYDIELATKSKHKMVLTPGFLLKATTGALKVDINAILSYDDFLWGGIVYRVQNAVGIMAGVNYNGLRLGISYDYTMNSLFAKGSRNSTEIFIKYCYPIYPAVIKRSGYNTRNL